MLDNLAERSILDAGCKIDDKASTLLARALRKNYCLTSIDLPGMAVCIFVLSFFVLDQYQRSQTDEVGTGQVQSLCISEVIRDSLQPIKQWLRSLATTPTGSVQKMRLVLGEPKPCLTCLMRTVPSLDLGLMVSSKKGCWSFERKETQSCNFDMLCSYNRRPPDSLHQRLKLLNSSPM